MTRGDPIPHGPSHKFEQLPFGHFVVRLHAHHLRCVHSFKHGFGNAPPFTSQRMTKFAFFCYEIMHLFEVLGEQHLVAYAMEHVLTLHKHFDPILTQSKSF
jgi:hypothetical protein